MIWSRRFRSTGPNLTPLHGGPSGPAGGIRPRRVEHEVSPGQRRAVVAVRRAAAGSVEQQAPGVGQAVGGRAVDDQLVTVVNADPLLRMQRHRQVRRVVHRLLDGDGPSGGADDAIVRGVLGCGRIERLVEGQD